jgi:site-specific recombinase XerD
MSTHSLFRESCKDGQQLEQLERKDLLAFMVKLKTDGKEARTVPNHISLLKVFFRRYGVAWPLLKKGQAE